MRRLPLLTKMRTAAQPILWETFGTKAHFSRLPCASLGRVGNRWLVRGQLFEWLFLCLDYIR